MNKNLLKITGFLVAFILAFTVVPSSASASALTFDQAESIISMLYSFGADQDAIDNVRIILNNLLYSQSYADLVASELSE